MKPEFPEDRKDGPPRAMAFLRTNPMLALLVFVPIVIVAEQVVPESHKLIFFLSVAAIVPLAALLSASTESVAARTGDTVGGVLNATLGNMTELVIALMALREGMYELVKASIAGAIVTNLLFMLGASFVFGGLRHHVQKYNPVNTGMQTGMLLLATIALLIPSLVMRNETPLAAGYARTLSVGLAVLLISVYILGLLFTLKTHPDLFVSASHAEEGGYLMPLGIAVGMLVVVTGLIAVVSEIFVGSVQKAASSMGMSPAFVGFIIVSLVGGAAEMATAFSAARKNRLDLSVGIAMGSSTQIALFVAPVLVLTSYVLGPAPMDLSFSNAAVIMLVLATLAISILATNGQAHWFAGVQLLAVYAAFAIALYLVPPGTKVQTTPKAPQQDVPAAHDAAVR